MKTTSSGGEGLSDKGSRELGKLAIETLSRLRTVPLHPGEIVMVLGLAYAMAITEMGADFLKLESFRTGALLVKQKAGRKR